MSETLVQENAQAPEFVPASPEVQAAEQAATPRTIAATAIEELMRTDPSAQFEYPAGMSGNRGTSYTVPSGDA
jgi:hypothetical protein